MDLSGLKGLVRKLPKQRGLETVSLKALSSQLTCRKEVPLAHAE
jgi:hypothetical protein